MHLLHQTAAHQKPISIVQIHYWNSKIPKYSSKPLLLESEHQSLKKKILSSEEEEEEEEEGNRTQAKKENEKGRHTWSDLSLLEGSRTQVSPLPSSLYLVSVPCFSRTQSNPRRSTCFNKTQSNLGNRDEEEGEC